MEMAFRQDNLGHHERNNIDRFGSNDDIDLLKTKYKPGGFRVYHDFYKTKMCNLFLLNLCKKGNDCPFAHSEDEIREKPNLEKTKLCPQFLEEGKCNKGNRCAFAHGEEELRSTPDLFKTAICNLWSQGKCTSGERCRFAHGPKDLRPAPSYYKPRKGNGKKEFNHENQHYHKGQENHQQNFVQQFQSPQNFPSYPAPNTFEYFMYPEVNVTEHFQDDNIMGAFSKNNKTTFSNFDY